MNRRFLALIRDLDFLECETHYLNVYKIIFKAVDGFIIRIEIYIEFQVQCSLSRHELVEN